MLQSLLGYRQPQPTTGFRTRPQIETVTPVQLHQRLNEPGAPLVVDVRSPEEYKLDGHISGSRLLPLPMLLQRSDEIPQDRPVVFVCRSGSRSQAACEQLAARGYTNVINMGGGMIGWRSAGLPSE